MESQCEVCSKIKKLTTCHECYWNYLITSIAQSTAGDSANRIYWKLENRFDELIDTIKNELKDKQIVVRPMRKTKN